MLSSPSDKKEASSAYDSRDTYPTDKKAPLPQGDEKATSTDEALARQMQDDWNNANTGFSNSTRPKKDVQLASNKSPFGAPSTASTRQQLPQYSNTTRLGPPHMNPVIAAGDMRAIAEQEMQTWLQRLQYQYRLYNSELEPEHDSDYPCGCEIHRYTRAKWARCGVQDMWNAAVLYPGEKAYNANQPYNNNLCSGNPYQFRTMSPYGPFSSSWGPKVPSAKYHAMWTTQTIALNNSLNVDAQAAIDAKEPKISIWDGDSIEESMSRVTIGIDDKKQTGAPGLGGRKDSVKGASGGGGMSKFRKSIGFLSSEERRTTKAIKAIGKGQQLKEDILKEEQGRWPDKQWRDIVQIYQEKTAMAKKIADLRARHPIQYFHLLRAGYFEPIPVAWADSVSNPLKFTIEPSAGWRGITPTWRGYEDTAEERLYWVLNHREGSDTGSRLKPDFISALNMARERMETAVAPPPEYYDVNDVCHVQHKSDGYSKQVMPPPFKAFDRPETPTDDTMILLDVSGSMDFTPQSPIYDRYLITGYRTSEQPKNKDVAKAIIRRFSDAMMNHDHAFSGYDLTTFSTHAKYIGTVNHQNLDNLWSTIKIGGGTRVMTGWQKVKQLHFEKHNESAIHHPVYGWQAGPNTPMLRLLLLLDGEATDMDEFELDLLGLSWAHVTIFLIGVDGCPHHHRHANELQRISNVNHHVSFVDAQGNTPERFVTHELLKRHLGYEVSLSEFKELETPPTYFEATRA